MSKRLVDDERKRRRTSSTFFQQSVRVDVSFTHGGEDLRRVMNCDQNLFMQYLSQMLGGHLSSSIGLKGRFRYRCTRSDIVRR
jgi:hypothetical protein